MEKAYLMTPVIEIEDGDIIKGFKMLPLIIIAVIFGLVPTTMLCIINCYWLRVKKPIIVLIICLTASILVGKYLVLYNYYNMNIDIITEYQTNSESNYSNVSAAEILDSESEYSNSIIERWDKLKFWTSFADRALAVLLAFCAYLIYKINYKIVLNLTETVVPIFGWASGCIFVYILACIKFSEYFFGGSIWI